MLPLQSLIRARHQVGDLPPAPDAPAGPPAALTSARVAAASPGRATFAGPASDGEPLTVQVTAVMAGVVRVSLSRDGSQRPRSETALPLVRDPARVIDAAGAVTQRGPGSPGRARCG